VSFPKIKSLEKNLQNTAERLVLIPKKNGFENGALDGLMLMPKQTHQDRREWAFILGKG